MMATKTCRRCQTPKGLDEFRADPRYADGLGSWCRQCHRERNAEWAKANPDRQRKRVAEWRSSNPEKTREINCRHKAANRDALAQNYADWAKNNRDKRRATNAQRKAAKLRAIPPWASRSAIKAVYKEATNIQRETGVRMHVDHIIPLQHPLVCGLHCEDNLRVIPGAANESKRNRWDPDSPIEAAYKQPRLFAEPVAKPVQDNLFGGGEAA